MRCNLLDNKLLGFVLPIVFFFDGDVLRPLPKVIIGDDLFQLFHNGFFFRTSFCPSFRVRRAGVWCFNQDEVLGRLRRSKLSDIFGLEEGVAANYLVHIH